MANHLKMAERETILTLHRQGWSKRRIARELGVDRGTVRRVLRANRELSNGESPAVTHGTAETHSKTPTPAEVLTGSPTTGSSKTPTPVEVLTGSPKATGGRSKCEAYRQEIEQKLKSGLSAQRIFQD